MKQVKHIFLSLFIILSLYVTSMFALKKINYKQKPIIYITNDYYTWKGGDTYEKYQEFKEQQQHDVIFVGSSRAYRGYSPLIFEAAGYQSFNLGTSAQTIKNTYFTIKHFISKTNCKLLIIDVFSGAFTNSQLESTSDLIENISKPQAAYDIAFHSKDIRALNMAGLRYLTENDGAHFKMDNKVDKGYSSKADSLPIEKQQYYFLRKPINHPKIEIDEVQLEYFDKILSICKERSIKVVCVYAPVSYFYDHTQHQSFLALIEPSLTRSNIPFYDLSDLKGINTAYHFYDDSHLNHVGVALFNNELIQQLQNDNLLQKNEGN